MELRHSKSHRAVFLCAILVNPLDMAKVALVHGISMGEGASLMVPMKFSVVTEKSGFATPEKDLETKIEKSRKQIKECKNRAKKICGVKKISFRVLTDGSLDGWIAFDLKLL
ncbi:uncharacterized protein LOC131012956 isoform X1 [Salvia miltiorrhiza]|nr:uncharacterized protein LOC131012956 isoform X1 [Salvia miltiorrhiza]XP_057796923.1 uncharacterized protein LOC131012956 isoform X1 [Salvia miltiorrhiza]XP_057796924.1 uncharacterized protein LOC131012956 isoform X1 [Salvia miltiorrhiza]